MKPVVQIKDACIVGDPEIVQVLFGTVLDYPEEHMVYEKAVTNGHIVRTSKIVEIRGDVVETERTIYQVQSWLK